MTSIYEDLVKEYAALAANVEPQQARMDDIKKVLRDLDYGSHELAGLKVQVSPNRRIDAKAFRDRYPVAQRPEFYSEPAPKTAEVRKHLAPAEIEELSTEGDKRVSIK